MLRSITYMHVLSRTREHQGGQALPASVLKNQNFSWWVGVVVVERQEAGRQWWQVGNAAYHVAIIIQKRNSLPARRMAGYSQAGMVEGK